MYIRSIAILMLFGFAPIVGCSDDPETPAVTDSIREEQNKAQEEVDRAEKQEMMKNAKQRNGR